jgi:hypothetical protein
MVDEVEGNNTGGEAMAPELIEKIQKATEAKKEVSFWTGKTPCWEMAHCPAMIREECPATRYPFLPCWQIEGTYCKLDDYGATGTDTSICEICRVYKKWGKGEPIQLKLFGRGIDNSLKALEKLATR